MWLCLRPAVASEYPRPRSSLDKIGRTHLARSLPVLDSLVRRDTRLTACLPIVPADRVFSALWTTMEAGGGGTLSHLFRPVRIHSTYPVVMVSFQHLRLPHRLPFPCNYVQESSIHSTTHLPVVHPSHHPEAGKKKKKASTRPAALQPAGTGV